MGKDDPGKNDEPESRFFGPRGRGRDPRLPEACARCGREVGLPYHPDDWVMRLDPQAPGGVAALCPECAASSPRKRGY